MPRRINNIRWRRVLTDRTRGGGSSFQGFAGVCRLGGTQMGAIFGEHIEETFNGSFFTLAPAKWKHRFYVSDDNGLNWRLASEIPTDGSGGLNYATGLFKSGMLGSKPGTAFHSQSGQFTNSGSLIFNRAGGIYRTRDFGGKWERVLTPGGVALAGSGQIINPGYDPNNVFSMTAALVNNGPSFPGNGRVSPGTHQWALTHVYGGGESQIYAMSNVLTVPDDEFDWIVGIGGWPKPPDGGFVRLYRTKATDAGSYPADPVTGRERFFFTGQLHNPRIGGDLPGGFSGDPSIVDVNVDEDLTFHPPANSGYGSDFTTPSLGAVDFHIFCDFANLREFGDDQNLLACGEFDNGSGSTATFFYFLRSTDHGNAGSWERYGDSGDLPIALKFSSDLNIDGIVTMLQCRDIGALLAGAHMSARSPRAWWSNREGRPGSWREILFPGNYDQFNTEQFCEMFINFGNGIIVAGGGAPTGKFPVSNSTYPDGIPFTTYLQMHGYTIVPGTFFNDYLDANGNPDNGYWHYPVLWRTTTGPGGTWAERSLTIGNFADRTSIPGGQPGAIGDIDGEWRAHCGVGLGGGTGCLGLYINPFNYTTTESPFWATNDYGESFPFPGEFIREPYYWFVPQQMAVTNDGNILVGAFVEDPFVGQVGELWLGIVEATEYYSLGFMERPADR